MLVETFYPTDKRLRNCIEYYYFLKSDSPDFNSEYYAFPNTLQALNIHKNIKCEIAAHAVKVTGIAKNNFTMLLQGRFDLPLYAQLRGRIDKITIIFKPLGLNCFIASPFNKISGNPTQLFTEWDYHEKHDEFLNKFFSRSGFSNRIKTLEEYLLLHYRPLNHTEILKPALRLLTDFNNELSIGEIAGKINLSTRTFDRMFKQHLGISPVGYRKVARFRHSLKNRIVNQQYKKLTEIGYESNFYDQFYFIKMYKKLTNSTPGKFFDLVEKLADDQLILKLIKR